MIKECIGQVPSRVSVIECVPNINVVLRYVCTCICIGS